MNPLCFNFYLYIIFICVRFVALSAGTSSRFEKGNKTYLPYGLAFNLVVSTIKRQGKLGAYIDKYVYS